MASLQERHNNQPMLISVPYTTTTNPCSKSGTPFQSPDVRPVPHELSCQAHQAQNPVDELPAHLLADHLVTRSSTRASRGDEVCEAKVGEGGEGRGGGGEVKEGEGRGFVSRADPSKRVPKRMGVLVRPPPPPQKKKKTELLASELCLHKKRKKHRSVGPDDWPTTWEGAKNKKLTWASPFRFRVERRTPRGNRGAAKSGFPLASL